MQTCPVCTRELPEMLRYPRMVCAECKQRARAKDGRQVEFFNHDLSGGLMGRYSDTGEEYHHAACFIDEIPCRAEEGRFGGVIVQTIELPG